MHALRNVTLPGLAAFALLGMAACSDPGTATVPSPPANAVTCVGHTEIYTEGGDTVRGNVWYAYWVEPADTAAGILEVGVIDSSRNSVVEDRLYLDRSGQWLTFAPSDPRAVDYADTTSLYTMYGSDTSDSLIIRYGWEFSSTNYYLKKLN